MGSNDFESGAVTASQAMIRIRARSANAKPRLIQSLRRDGARGGSPVCSGAKSSKSGGDGGASRRKNRSHGLARPLDEEIGAYELASVIPDAVLYCYNSKAKEKVTPSCGVLP